MDFPRQEIQLFRRAGDPLAGKRGIGTKEFFRYPVIGPAPPIEAKPWLREYHPERLTADALSVECSHHALLKRVVHGSDSIGAAAKEAIAGEVKRVTSHFA